MNISYQDKFCMIYKYPYTEISNWAGPLPNSLIIQDHLGGFCQDGSNAILDQLNLIASTQEKTLSIVYHQILDSTVKIRYPNLEIKFDLDFQNRANLNSFHKYNTHPEINFKNFVCSFNGTAHVSRKLLVSILRRFNWFSPGYSSKNFSYSTDSVDGHISESVGDNESFYRKFFISDTSEEFFQTNYSFGHVRFNHKKNIYNLENKLTESFLHIVSETMATSYYPFVTEKFLYSIVTRGLFLAYAQPGWHDHVEKYYGFKRYTKLFDYRFDTIQNPVERLVELMSMISKFSVLSSDDWKDLYLLEQDTIEYNYDHYFSKDYLVALKKHDDKL
jgi:hypothetical protein